MKIGQDIESKEDIEIEDEKSRRILICGKTGSGKSYSMGVILEELADRTDIFLIVVDPQGIFWTMINPNRSQESELWEWNLSPNGYPVNLLVPGNPEERYGGKEIVEKLLQYKSFEENLLLLNMLLKLA